MNFKVPTTPRVDASKLFETISFPLPGGFVFAPSYFQAIAIVVLIFLLILTLGQLRKRYFGWHISGILPGVMFGFSIALIIEGLLIVGGRTILTEILGWKSAPKPIVNVLDAGRNQLVDVLGVSSEIPSLNAAVKPTIGGIMDQYSKLGIDEQDGLRSIVCKQE